MTMSIYAVTDLYNLYSYRARTGSPQDIKFRTHALGNSLEVQWLRLGTFPAGAQVQFPGEGTKILQATRCGQKKKKNPCP